MALRRRGSRRPFLPLGCRSAIPMRLCVCGRSEGKPDGWCIRGRSWLVVWLKNRDNRPHDGPHSEHPINQRVGPFAEARVRADGVGEQAEGDVNGEDDEDGGHGVVVVGNSSCSRPSSGSLWLFWSIVKVWVQGMNRSTAS